MCTYKTTSLWRNAFCSTSSDTKCIDRLIAEYDLIRSNIKEILDRIQKDFPNLTIHDISHVDSLWTVASEIVGDDYKINPLEGFILGCSFLLHDSALSYDVYGGKSKLRELPEWKSARLFDENMTDDDIDFLIIRQLHAKQSAILLDKRFKFDNDELRYILPDEEIRLYYKKTIGIIAASHHQCIEEISILDKQLNPDANFPNSWIINVQKLACILRCADAAHIDNARAPLHILKELNTNEESKNHWSAQSHISQVNRHKDKEGELLFTSIIPFEEKDFKAWNIIYNLIQVCDRELKSCEDILEGDERFLCKKVAGATSKTELCKYIKTEGWIPKNANIHISNIQSLIVSLGGEKLYGTANQDLIVLRELIQNGRDAIIARTKLDDSFKGRISVKLLNRDDESILEVEDNGVGMSENILTSIFLDFGQSLWRSHTVLEEYPSLILNDFHAIGKYGIGFFSVFMIAKSVEVITKRYDHGLEQTSRLKFLDGLITEPIYSKGRVENFSMGNSTRIILVLKNKIDIHSRQVFIDNQKSINALFANVIATICCGLDVDVYFNNNIVHTNIYDDRFDKKQWLRRISYAEERNDSMLNKYIDDNYHRLDFIKKNDRIVGLAAINTSLFVPQPLLSVATIEGLTSNINYRSAPNFIGYIDVPNLIASRDEMSVKFDLFKEQHIQNWLDKQKTEFGTISKEIAPGFTLNAMNFQYPTFDIGCLLSYYNKATIFGPISFTSMIDNIQKGGKLYFIVFPQYQTEESSGYKGLFEVNYDGASISKMIDNKPYDMVPFLGFNGICNLPIESVFRQYRLFRIKNKLIPVDEITIIGSILKKAREMCISINISFEKDYIQYTDKTYRNVIILEQS